MENQNYKTITEEELLEEINKKFLNVKYYYHLPAIDRPEEERKIEHNISLGLNIDSVSRMIIYADHWSNEYAINLRDMVSHLQPGEIVIFESLYNLAYSSDDILESLAHFSNNDIDMYVEDTEIGKFIKINPVDLLAKIAQETLYDAGETLEEYFGQIVEKVSKKYYDGKLIR